jgi:hypothetical protein
MGWDLHGVENDTYTSSALIQHSILGRISPVFQRGRVESLSSSSVEILLQYLVDDINLD